MNKPVNLFKLVMCAAMLLMGGLHSAKAQEAASNETIVKYLSGRGYGDTVEWDFFCTGGQNSGKWTKIGVPSCWEQQGFGAYTYGVVYYGKNTAPGISDEQGMYKYEFEVPAEWQGRRTRIVFDGSMTDTDVKINGVKAGSTHQGAFYRFKHDISHLLKYGQKNLLEVTVSKESSNPSVNLAERRADYWNFGGIFRPVFLESSPALFIDRTAMDAKADGSFLAELFLAEGAAKDYTVKAQLSTTDGKPFGKPVTGTFSKGTDKATVTGKFADAKLWTAETPNLYNVKVELFDGAKLVHSVKERIGFRTIEIRPSDGIYVNGTKILIKGINRHSFWPESGRTLNKELNYADVRLMKEMNMNAVRMSHYPPDPEFLDACDELGLYVMDELTGWHGKYDTATGRKLIAELIKRDVNHPSIIFWSNGNEGGWNVENDGEFVKWDPQARPVLHPQQFLSGVETMHYRSYGETQEFLRGDYIYMPTEFLHGLYDGGHGAGLWDYWEMMRNHPRCAGGYLWVYADEGVVRTDQGGRIDNYTNFGADGIIGPHHEKEGSFYTVKEVWSPVVVTTPETLPADFNGVFDVENRYDFTNLNQCTFEWALADFNKPGSGKSSHTVKTSGKIKGSDIAPMNSGKLSVKLPADWRNSDVLYLTARDKDGAELWRWGWSWKDANGLYKMPANAKTRANVMMEQDADKITVNAAGTELTFSKKDGELKKVVSNGKTISFANGPRFVAARRANRTLDGDTNMDAPKGVDRVYNEIEAASELRNITATADAEKATITADYFGAMRKAVWNIYSDGRIVLDYEYGYDGVVELMGIKFDYPEEQMKSITWLGKGPYRVWQNRLHGTTLDVWSNDYNDPIPGETFIYPEFKGYFNDWRWADFTTGEGNIIIGNNKAGSYLGVFTPRDGRDALLYTIPQTGLAVFDVIPAVRNKVNATDLVGPSSQAQRVSGTQKGSIQLNFTAK